MTKPQEIAVIGGGLPGIVTTILLAGQKNADKSPKFHITLIDKSDQLLSGASIVASRLHLGNEYPLDEVTAKDCLKSAVIWKLLMPKNNTEFYTSMEKMKFTLAPETEAAGELTAKLIKEGDQGKLRMKDGSFLRVVSSAPDIAAGELETLTRIETSLDGRRWQPADVSPSSKQCWITDSGIELTATANGQLQHLTYRDYLYHVEELRREYGKLFNEVDAASGWKKQTTTNWKERVTDGKEQEDPDGKDRTSEVLFGKPEQFFRDLEPTVLKTWNVKHGFQSNEPGINVPYFHAYLLQVLAKLEKEGTVTRVTGAVESKPEKKGDKFTVHIAGWDKPLVVDQVALAANENNAALGGLLEGETATVYNRAMLVLNTRDMPKPREFNSFFAPIFKMLGQFGGMHCPYNETISVDYIPHPLAAYRGGSKKLTVEDPTIPSTWHRGYFPADKAPGDIKQWIDDYFKLVVAKFPHLEHAHPEGLIVQNTLNFQPDLERRQHQSSHEVEAGLTVINANKATYAFRNAIEAVEVIKARSEAQQADKAADPRTPEPITLPSDLAYRLALQGKYAIPNLGKLNSIAAKQRSIAVGMNPFTADQPSGDWRGLRDRGPGASR